MQRPSPVTAFRRQVGRSDGRGPPWEELPPVAPFPVVPGRSWGPGWWWSATTGGHVMHGSVAMRTQLMVGPRPGILEYHREARQVIGDAVLVDAVGAAPHLATESGGNDGTGWSGAISRRLKIVSRTVPPRFSRMPDHQRTGGSSLQESTTLPTPLWTVRCQTIVEKSAASTVLGASMSPCRTRPDALSTAMVTLNSLTMLAAGPTSAGHRAVPSPPPRSAARQEG